MRSKSTNERSIQVEQGSGNVFADLGLPNPESALAKAKLVQRIRDLISERKLSQVKAAKLLGLDQPKVSALVRGRVEGYSIDRLFRILNALGQQVEITVRPNVGERETVIASVNQARHEFVAGQCRAMTAAEIVREALS